MGKAKTMSSEGCDLIIIGGGPAGLTAGLYAVRARLKTLLLEKLPLLGGQIMYAEKVENYPGFPEGVSGQELTRLMETQATAFGLEIRNSEVSGVRIEGAVKVVTTDEGECIGKAVIVATGASPNRLGVEGEERLIGRGISFCGTCDGFFFKGLDIILVGGGDTAMEEALFLTKFANKVTIVHRRDALRATKVLQERVFSNHKINVIWDSVVEKIEGERSVERVVLKNLKTGQITTQATSGVLIFVGTTPSTQFLGGLLKSDEQGYLLTNDRLETSQPGIFAAGDARKKLLRQVATAVGDGAAAAYAAERYLEDIVA
jgi:thioredoxin reductase (NADPH)